MTQSYKVSAEKLRKTSRHNKGARYVAHLIVTGACGALTVIGGFYGDTAVQAKRAAHIFFQSNLEGETA